MDPLSMAASVAGLMSLTIQVSQTVRSYCRSVKDARKDVLDVAQELASMQDILHQLDQLLRYQQLQSNLFDSSSVLATALTTCGDGMKKISTKVQTMEQDGLARVWGKLKWPFSEKEMVKTLATLRRCAATFQFALTIEGCVLLSRSSQDATKSLELQLQTATRVLELTRGVATMAESAKEAVKVSTQVSEILKLASDYSPTVQAVQSLSKGVDALVIRSQDNKENEILSWLSSYKHSRIHNDIRARRMVGTGQWFLQRTEFQVWMHESESTLWCSGSPGVGKSVLTSLVIDHILENHLSPNEAIAYFYFDYRDQQVQTPAYFLASLLRQLAAQRKPFARSLLDFYDRFKDEQPQDLMTELCEAFRLTCEAYETCFIVIDALDECKNQGYRKEITRVLESLPTARTKIFVTSRPHPHDVKQYLGQALRIEIEASETDIKHYCSRMIEESPNAAYLMSDTLKQQVLDSIAGKACGMFLLPVLQLQSILEAMTKSEIKASLKNLSASLGQAFENTIRRIESEPHNRRRVAIQALMWVSHARRPLQVDELSHALATNFGDTELDRDNLLPARAIIESCSGLIALDDESSTVRLVHYTLQDFLQSREPQLFLQEETYITRVLLTYLSFDEAKNSDITDKTMGDEHFDTDEHLLIYSSFLEYAAANWGHHAKVSEPSEIDELALAFLENECKLARAMRSRTRSLIHSGEHFRLRDPWDSRNRRKRSALHVVAEFGLVELLGSLIDRGLHIHARDSYKNTALHEAAIHGQTDALNLLLDHGADINVRNFYHNTPLYLAVTFSHEQSISKLLERGAQVDDYCIDDWSPLHKAADNGHVTIAQRLLDHGASIFARSARGLIPLHRAAGRGHVQMTEQLIEHGSPVDMTSWDGWTPLHGASSSGQEKVVKILLDHNAEINHQSADERTALHRACRAGHYAVVLRLLEANANIWVRDCYANIPLHRAAKGGHGKVCRLLLEKGSVPPLAQLSALNAQGFKPEKEASRSGHWRVTAFLRDEELLHKGVNVRERDDLELAIDTDELSRVQELISHGVDVDKLNDDSLTPLNRALLLGKESIARLLLESNANIATATSDGWQPLHCAASKGMADIVSLCLSRKADIAARTLDGQTALHRSCNSGSVEAVRVLVDAGADIEARDDSGWRPLHTASAAGFQEVVELLIAADANLGARDKGGRTVQACAAMAGKHALVEYLREARHEL